MTKIRGDGIAASIPARTRGNVRAASRLPSTKPAQAWRVFLSKRTETDFQEWRDQRDWTARKYALWDAGKKLEPPSHGPGKPRSRFRKCPSGEVFDMHRLHENLIHVPHISRAEAVHTQ